MPARSARSPLMRNRAPANVVQMLLFRTVVHAFAGERQSQEIAVKFQTFLRIRYDDRRVIDARDQLSGLLAASAGHPCLEGSK